MKMICQIFSLFLLIFLLSFSKPTSAKILQYEGASTKYIDCGGGDEIQIGLCHWYMCVDRPCNSYIGVDIPFLDLSAKITGQALVESDLQPKPINMKAQFDSLRNKGYDLAKCKFKIGRYWGVGATRVYELLYYDNVAQIDNNNPSGIIYPDQYGVKLSDFGKEIVSNAIESLKEQGKGKEKCAIISLSKEDTARLKTVGTLCNYNNIQILCPPLSQQDSYPIINPPISPNSLQPQPSETMPPQPKPTLIDPQKELLKKARKLASEMGPASLLSNGKKEAIDMYKALTGKNGDPIQMGSSSPKLSIGEIENRLMNNQPVILNFSQFGIDGYPMVALNYSNNQLTYYSPLTGGIITSQVTYGQFSQNTGEYYVNYPVTFGPLPYIQSMWEIP